MFTGLTPLAALDAALLDPRRSADAALELAWRLRLRDRERSRAHVAAVRHRAAAAGRVALFEWRDTPPADADAVLALAARDDLDPLWTLRALVVGADFLLDALAAPESERLAQAVREALPATAGIAGPGDLQTVENMFGRVAAPFPHRRRLAIGHYERAAELAELAGEPIAGAISLVNAASVRATLDDPSGALETYLRALALAEGGHAPPRVLGFVHGNVASLYRTLGALEPARFHADRAVEVTGRSEPAHLLRQSLAVQARVHLTAGELPGATRSLDALLQATEGEGGPHRQVAQTLLAHVDTLAGRPLEALARLADDAPIDHPEAALERAFVRSRALSLAGRPGDAVEALAPHATETVRTLDPLHDEALERHIADLRALGRHDEAIEALLARNRYLQEATRGRARLAGLARDLEVHAARASADDASAQARELQTQLQRAQRLEAFGQMAAGLAHDFNNALAVVMAGTDALAMHPRTPPEASSLQAIQRALEQARALTRRLAAVARRSELRIVEVDLARHLDEAGPMLQAATAPCHLHVTTEALPPVRLDPDLLDQALLNLVINARDASAPGADVHLEVRARSHHVALAVRDQGVGIAAADLQRVFDPSFTTKGEQGTGLGLAMVWGIAQQLGGDVSVESPPGAGTTFTLLLPFA